jgi:hypothetical protein
MGQTNDGSISDPASASEAAGSATPVPVPESLEQLRARLIAKYHGRRR